MSMRMTITIPKETNDWLRKQSYAFNMSKSRIINLILGDQVFAGKKVAEYMRDLLIKNKN